LKTSYIRKQTIKTSPYYWRSEAINCCVVILTHKLRNKLIDKSVNQYKGKCTENLLRGGKKPPMQPLSKMDHAIAARSC